ncbi:zinc-dependent metalloprotease [Actinocorallia sp. B10E7]|uniref:zinc-dependent metalloprotease n=1 Tax=Actinocorallia sp. B10E7 TaxID=3153558 RepID=UPI00325E9210
MIDWGTAVQTGARLVRPGPQVSAQEARAVVTELRDLSAVAEVHVREFTRMDVPPSSQPATVVDRPGWIKANVEGFRVVLEPLVDQLSQRRTVPTGPMGIAADIVGPRVTGMQMGAILAYMASRVLGQYELFLPPDPSGNAPTGRLTLVAPNIVHVEQELSVDQRDFRLWVCLHEETHRAQFTAVPWLRTYVQEQMTQFLLASDISPAELFDRIKDAAEAVADAVRGGESTLIDAIQTPAQREILDRLTAVMTLVEGHGDFVMDAVGPEVVPSVAQIRAKFSSRRGGGSKLDKTLRRLLGIDLKMKQYAEGSRFVRRVHTEIGMAGFNRVWTSPETLPTMAEISDPSLWIRRVGLPPLEGEMLSLEKPNGTES